MCLGMRPKAGRFWLTFKVGLCRGAFCLFGFDGIDLELHDCGMGRWERRTMPSHGAQSRRAGFGYAKCAGSRTYHPRQLVAALMADKLFLARAFAHVEATVRPVWYLSDQSCFGYVECAGCLNLPLPADGDFNQDREVVPGTG